VKVSKSGGGSVIDWAKRWFEERRKEYHETVETPFRILDATTRQQEDDLISMIFEQRVETRTALILPAAVDFSLESNQDIWRSILDRLQSEVNNALTEMTVQHLESRQDLTRVGAEVVLRLVDGTPENQEVLATQGSVSITRVAFDEIHGYDFGSSPTGRQPKAHRGAKDLDPTRPLTVESRDCDETAPLGAAVDATLYVELWAPQSAGQPPTRLGSVAAYLGLAIGRQIGTALDVPKHLREISHTALVVVEATESSVTFEVRNRHGALVDNVQATLERGGHVTLKSGDTLTLPTSDGVVMVVVR
jgi:hypothetical protein